VPDQLANGFPTWKQKKGSNWIYSGTNGMWWIATQTDKIKRDGAFNCSAGYIAHGGKMPDSVVGPWKSYDGSGCKDDDTVKITTSKA